MDDNKVAVLIENLMSQFHTFGEGLDGFTDEMKAFRGETNHRLDNLEQKVTDIKLEISNLKADNKIKHQQIKVFLWFRLMNSNPSYFNYP